MIRRAVVLVALLIASTSCVPGRDAYVVGAVYPTGGAQGDGGIDEWRGVDLAAEYVNAHGGVGGRPVEVRLQGAEQREDAPAAVDALADDGVKVVLGSYGSTISQPAAAAAARRGLVFWETGAVGELGMQLAPSQPVFRYPTSGVVLGREAVAFVRDRLDLGKGLRYTVAYVDDVYGRSVGTGAIREIQDSGLTLAAKLPYDLRTVDYRDLVDRIAAAKTDVLVVSAYLDDGVAMRKEVVRRKVPLKANIGTSSSYCMSDKPDGNVPDEDDLQPEAAAALRWIRATYPERFNDELAAPVLTGFSGAFALFRHVLTEAKDGSQQAVVRAARAADVPRGGLPDGGGLRFGGSGPDAGGNQRAVHVIWEWVARRERAVVWPPELASHAIVPPR